MRRRRLVYLRTVERILNSNVLVVVLGGMIVQSVAVQHQSAAKERELAVTAAQERARLSVEWRRDTLHERDQASRRAFETVSKMVTAAEDVMGIEEKAWRDLKYAPADRKVVADYENKLREAYNAAVSEWDYSKDGFEPNFGAIDAHDSAPTAWRGARTAADHLKQCIEKWFTALPPTTAPADHPCRASAQASREALSKLSGAMSLSKRRLFDELTPPVQSR
jgi:hypothetical protein